MKVCIVIPAYNEEKRIGKTLEEYGNFFEKLRKEHKLSYELLIVINNTRDNTESIVRKYMLKNPNIGYLNLIPGGKGFAVIEGFKDALKRNNDLIGFVDADCATGAEEFFKLVKAINGYDGVIADRYLKGSVIIPRPSLARLFAKRLFNFWSRSLLMIPFGDTQCGAKVFRRKVIDKVLPKLTMSQWAFDVELLYNAHEIGYKIKPFPTKWSDKAYSTINFWQSGPWMALAIVRLRLIHSPFKDFVRLYDKGIKIIKKTK